MSRFVLLIVFTAVGMALRTVAAVVAIFFLMFVVHFLL